MLYIISGQSFRYHLKRCMENKVFIAFDLFDYSLYPPTKLACFTMICSSTSSYKISLFHCDLFIHFLLKVSHLQMNFGCCRCTVSIMPGTHSC